MDVGKIEFGNENVGKMKMIADWKMMTESSDEVPRHKSLSGLFVFASRRRQCNCNLAWEQGHQREYGRMFVSPYRVLGPNTPHLSL